MKDKRGADIVKGGYAIWIDNRASSATGLYEVLDVKIKVKVGSEDGAWSTWVFPDSVIMVDSVPHVEGMRNTKRGTKAWQKLRKSS